MSAIKKSVAMLLCSKIRQENKCRWFTPSGLTCRLCVGSSKENPIKMKMYKKNRYDGCRLVNSWYSKLTGSEGKAKFKKLKGGD